MNKTIENAVEFGKEGAWALKMSYYDAKDHPLGKESEGIMEVIKMEQNQEQEEVAQEIVVEDYDDFGDFSFIADNLNDVFAL